MILFRTKKLHNIKGSALIYAIFTIIIVSILCLSIIEYVFINGEMATYAISTEQRLQNLISGINYLLLSDDLRFSKGFIPILIGTKEDTIYVRKKKWGLLSLFSVKTGKSGRVLKINALAGHYLDKEIEPTLYIFKQKNILTLSGQSFLSGKLFVPGKDIRRGYIESKPFKGSSLYSGTLFEPQSNQPRMNNELKELSFTDFYIDVMKGSKIALLNSLKSGTLAKVNKSFNDSVYFLFENGPITLNNCLFKGNIVIFSSKSIIIEADSQLEDVIIISPIIHFKTKFKGSVQAFARDSIILDSNSTLFYPSILCLLKDSRSDRVPCILIGNMSKICGAIFSNIQNQNSDKRLQYLLIGRDSEICGQIYFDGSVEHKGKVKGQIFCKEFILSTTSGYYINNLLDASIDIFALSNFFVGIDIFQSDSNNRIIKWLQ